VGIFSKETNTRKQHIFKHTKLWFLTGSLHYPDFVLETNGNQIETNAHIPKVTKLIMV